MKIDTCPDCCPEISAVLIFGPDGIRVKMTEDKSKSSGQVSRLLARYTVVVPELLVPWDYYTTSIPSTFATLVLRDFQEGKLDDLKTGND